MDDEPAPPNGSREPETGGEIEIIAHRGYSARAPENTLAAVRMALDVGATAVEWDIQVSASGTAFVFHDDTLDRTTDGRGRFADSADEAIAALDAGSWFGPAFVGEPVPTLSAALACLDQRVSRVYPEIKTFRSANHLRDIVAQVRDFGLLERSVFISMEWEALDQVRRDAPDAHIGYIVERPERYEEALTRASGDPRAILDPDYRIALGAPSLTRRAFDAGIPLAVWTVNDPDAADRLVALGVRGFTTNEVERLLEWAGALEAPGGD